MAHPDEPVLLRLHRLLLRVAGWAPDDVVTSARGWLAQGRTSEAARAALGAVLADRIPVRPDDADLLVRTLPGVPQVALLAGGVPATGEERPGYEFAPVLPQPADAAPPPLVLDLTGADDAGADPADAAAVRALADVAAPVALWRAWRSPHPGRGTGPVRVYLLETGGEAPDLVSATAWVQDALTAAGVADAQVETYGPGVELPAYQRAARGRAALLWAAAAPADVTVARVFDSYDPATGGHFDTDHPLLSEGEEPAKVLRYLDQGRILLATTARETDVFDTDAGAVVPGSFRTDGTWIWTDAVAYYLRTYALAPDADLLAHIRGRDHEFGEPDTVAEHRALAALTAPPPVRVAAP